jgi:hypothetical protein
MAYRNLGGTKAEQAARPSGGTGHNDTLGRASNELRDYGMPLVQVKTLPPIEVHRRPGESARSAARRWLDVQFGCYGE